MDTLKRDIQTQEFVMNVKDNKIIGDYSEHTERAKEIGKRSYEKFVSNENNRGKLNFNSKKYSEQNKEKRKETCARNREKHKAEIKSYNKEYNSNKRSCPFKRAQLNMQKYVWAYMKGILLSSNFDDVLGYSFEDLKQHLQSQFKEGMSWDNYGTYWEIDHKIPVSWFKIEDYLTPLNTIDLPLFKEFYAN